MKKTTKAKLRTKKTVTEDFVCENVNKLKVSYSAIDDVLEPNFFEHFIEVKAVCLTLSQNQRQEALINHRNLIIFDTGLKIIVPDGFKLNGKLVENFSYKGLYATDFILDENNNLKITVINLGQISQIAVQHKEVLAKVWIEPVYCFNLGKI